MPNWIGEGWNNFVGWLNQTVESVWGILAMALIAVVAVVIVLAIAIAVSAVAKPGKKGGDPK